MEHIADGPTVNDVLLESATITYDERRTRIKQCVAEGRHDPDTLPRCYSASPSEAVPYCDRCWSLIDSHGLTWSWLPSGSRNGRATAG